MHLSCIIMCRRGAMAIWDIRRSLKEWWVIWWETKSILEVNFPRNSWFCQKPKISHSFFYKFHGLGAVLFITPERVPHIEYLSVTLPSRGAFVFRAPQLSHISNIYYLPFSGMVWICGILLVIVCTVLVYMTNQFTRENDQNLISSDFLLFAISTVCQMGSDLIPKRMAGKIATVNLNQLPII